jgi:hypothetical protein
MADVRVRCINKYPHHLDPHHGITHIGGDGWKLTRDEAIRQIRAWLRSFFVLDGLKRSNVGVVDGPNGPYLRTHADGYWNNNLLSLMECIG